MSAFAQEGTQMLHKHLPPQVLSGQATMLSTLPLDQEMNVSIVLPLRHHDELTTLLARLYDPSDAYYRQFLSVAQFTQLFGPTVDDYNSVVKYARTSGLVVTGTPANRLLVPVRGSVDQISRAFHVTMNVYRHPTEDRTFFSPDREPSLDLSVPVAHISGLNNFSLPEPMLKRAQQALQSADIAGSGPSSSYLGSDMRAAYYGGSQLDGNGQTVGILAFGGYDRADVDQTFSSAGQSYSVPIVNVLLDGATGQTDYDDAEQVLDIVQTIGMAPGLSQVRVYIGKGLDDANILNSMASENLAKQLSSSWSWRPDDPAVDDPFFEEFAAQGQSFFTASGDYGAFDYEVSPFYYPAEDANVTAVGGTHLITNSPGGTWASETAWNSKGFGSGGGISPDGIAIPTWQTGVATTANGGSATYRNVPDVAMEGDFDNFSCDAGICYNDFAGTSFAAPRWAGFMALINQQAVEAGTAPRGGIGFLNPSLYAIGKSTRYTKEFHDIKVGDNNTNNQYYYFNAGTGYDLVTGWGSATGQALIDDLAGKQVAGFWLAPSLRTVAMGRGTSASTTITVTDAGGFSGNVTLSLTSALPTGVTASWGTNPTSGASVLTLTTTATAHLTTTTLVITGTSGALTATTRISLEVHSPTFELSSSNGNLQVTPSSSVTSTLTVTPEYGFAGNVQLFLSGLPSGVTASFSPNPSVGTSTLTLTASASVIGGTSTLTLKGVSGNLLISKPLSLVVAAPTFTLNVPQSLTMGQGTATSAYININPQYGFNGSVQLSAIGLPAGVTASFSPNPTANSTLLTLTASATAALGTQSVTIQGVSGKINTTATVSLGVYVPTFTLSGPTGVDIGVGASQTFYIYVNQKYGFNGRVAFTASGLPAGVTASFGLNTTQYGYNTVTLTADNTVALATTPVTITGTSGTQTATTTFPLSTHIPTFTLSTDGQLSVGQGTSSNTAVYVNLKYGFPGFVNLALSGLPSGVTASFSPNPTNGQSLLTLHCSSTVSLGNTPVKLIGASGSIKVTLPLTLVVVAPNFTLSSISSLTIGQGGTSTNSVGIISQNGFNGSVKLSVSGLPADITASFLLNPVSNGTVLMLTASSSAAVGTKTVTITGTSGNLTASTTFSLATYVPTYTLSGPGNISLGQGTSGTAYFNVNSQYGFTGSVAFNVTGLPKGVTASFSPNPTNGTSILTITASSTAAIGNTTLTVAGTTATQRRVTTLALSVYAPSFSLSSPTSLDIGQGTTATSTVYVSPIYGFSSPVNLSVSGLPSGVTLSISNNSTPGPFVLTFTANAKAPLSTSNLTITGTSGTLTASSTLALSIRAPSFTINGSTSINVCQGTSATNDFYIQPQYGFTGSPKLSIAGLPSGVTGSFSLNPTNNDTSLTLKASTTASPTTKNVTITGVAGALTASTTFPVTVCTPSFNVSGGDVTLAPGGSAVSYLYASSQTGFTGNIQFSVSGLPSGVTASFAPNPATYQSVMTLTASSAAVPGLRTLTITGTSGTLTASNTLTLTVATPTFSLYINGDTSITRGTRVTMPIYVNPNSGFSGNVQLSVSGLPSGLTASFSPNPTTGQSVLSLTATNAAAPGTKAITITGTSGSQIVTATFMLSVYPPSFTIQTTGGVDLGLGGSGTSFIFVNSYTGFTNSVNLAVSGLPSGVTGSFSSNPTAYGSSNLILNASTSAPFGQYNVTITGTALGQSSSTTIPVTILAPSFSLYGPSQLNVGRGTSSTTDVSISPLYGFKGAANLSVSGLPSGVTVSFSVNPVQQSTVMTVNASNTARLGTYTSTLTATSGTNTISKTFTIGIYNPTFRLYSYGIPDLGPGTSSTSYLGINASYGFTGSVKLSASGLPSGVTVSFSANPVTVTYGNSTMTIQASSSALPGRYNMILTGTAAGQSVSTTIPFNIYAPRFTLNGPYDVVLGRGTSTTAAASLYAQYGFMGSVTLSLVGLPSGVTASFSPNPTTGNSAITFKASTAAPLGQYTVMLIATSGTITQSVPFSLAIYTPTFTIYTPFGVDMGQGTSSKIYAQVNPEFGFASNVSFTASNLPSGVTASFAPNPTTTSTEVTLTASNTAPLGQYNVTIKGTSGSQSATTSFPLGIYVASFSLYGPGSIQMNQGASTNTYVQIGTQYGFSGNVTLAVSGLPNGVSASFAPNPPTNGYSLMSLKASASAEVGQYTLTLTGTSGAKKTSVPITLNVLKAP